MKICMMPQKKKKKKKKKGNAKVYSLFIIVSAMELTP